MHRSQPFAFAIAYRYIVASECRVANRLYLTKSLDFAPLLRRLVCLHYLTARILIPRSREGRDLERWVPDDGMDSSAFMLDGDSAGWDQFKANEVAFGVSTTFDESHYTSRLDKSNCAISEAEAARLAADIEGTKSYNAHLAEERGHRVDDSGVSALSDFAPSLNRCDSACRCRGCMLLVSIA